MAKNRSYKLQREEHKETRDSIDKLAEEMRTVGRGITRVLTTLDAHISKVPEGRTGRPDQWILLVGVAAIVFGLGNPLYGQNEQIVETLATIDERMRMDDDRERDDQGTLESHKEKIRSLERATWGAAVCIDKDW